MKTLREVVGATIAVVGLFGLVVEFVLSFPAGPGQPFNTLALSVFITSAVALLGFLMAGE